MPSFRILLILIHTINYSSNILPLNSIFGLAAIKKIIIYLLSQEVSIGTIREVVSKYGLSEPEIITLFEECKINVVNNPIEKKDARVVDLLVKLSLANILKIFMFLYSSMSSKNLSDFLAKT